MKLLLIICFVTTFLIQRLCTIRAIQDICTDGCPAHRLKGVSLPLDDFPHRIEVWQNESTLAAIFRGDSGGSLLVRPDGNWTTITTFHSEGLFCVSVEGVSEMLCHHSESDVLLITIPGTESLWKFDCDSASCGCRHYLFRGIGFSPEDLPARIYFRPDQASNQLFFMGDDLKNISVRQRQKWYDLTVSSVLDGAGGATFAVSSRSLGFGNLTFESSDGLWFFSGSGEEFVSTRFALDCNEPPRGGVRSRQESCTDGCPAHRLRGVWLPLYGLSQKVSVWQYGSGLIVAYSEENGEHTWIPTEGWTNISTKHYGGKNCIVFPEEYGSLCHNYKERVLLETLPGTKSFWRFDCHGDSCGCSEHLFYGIGFSAEDLPTKLYLRPEKDTNDVYLRLGFNVTAISLPKRRKWHDITIDLTLDEAGGKAYTVSSYSLDVRNWTFSSSDSIWIFAGSNDMRSFHIGLGCERAPKCSFTFVKRRRKKLPEDDIDVMYQNDVRRCRRKNPSYAPALILLAVPVGILVARIRSTMRRLRNRGTSTRGFPENGPRTSGYAEDTLQMREIQMSGSPERGVQTRGTPERGVQTRGTPERGVQTRGSP